jgi:nucleoside-diphosphate-sugar epimerase
MHVLVTGASGQVGRLLLRWLAAAQIDVTATTHTTCVSIPDNIQQYAVDLLDTAAVNSLIAHLRPTHLIHLAWVTSPRNYSELPVNLDWCAATNSLVREFTQAGGVRAIVAGTCFEYGGDHETWNEFHTPLRPWTLYGTAKKAAFETLTRFAAHTGLQLAWPRPFYLYGPDEPSFKMISESIRSFAAGESVRCLAPDRIVDYIHATDVAAAIVELLTSTLCGPCNLGTGCGTRLGDAFSLIAHRMNRLEQLAISGDGAAASAMSSGGAAAPQRIVADMSHTFKHLTWRPSIDLETGVSEMIDHVSVTIPG